MNYINVTYPDINNGKGVRTTIWFSGCPFHCKGCHNPETWDASLGKHFNASELYNEIMLLFKERPYLDGITLSGGDPLGHRSFDELHEIIDFLMLFKSSFPEKNIWIYSGAYYNDVIKDPTKRKVLDLCDVMVDGPFEIDKRDIRLAFRGSSNQRIIDLKNSTENNIKLINNE